MKQDPVIRDLERAIDLENKGKQAEAAIAARQLLTRHNTHPAAIQAAAIWARSAPDDPEAIFAVAMSYMAQGRMAEAIQGLRFTTQLNPRHALAWTNLGICIKGHEGDLAGALEATEQAVSIDPNNLNAQMNIIDILFAMGQIDEALAHSQELLKKNAHYAPLNGSVARCLTMQKKFDEAEPYLKKVISSQSQNVGYRLNYVANLYMTHRYDELAREIKATHRIFEKNPHFKRMFEREWKRNVFMNAIIENKIAHPHGKIVNMRDMMKIGHQSQALELVDDSHDVWLFKANNLKCFTRDWSLHDDTDLFMNLRVVGNWDVFLLGTYHNRAYIDDSFDQIEVNEPGILLGGVSNYYHWLMDFLPRIEILKTHPELKDLPIYLNEDVTEFQYQSLEHIGIARDCIRPLKKNAIATLNNVYIPFLPGRTIHDNGEPDWMKPNDNPFILKWLRDNFLDGVTPIAKKRYFVSRAGADFRRILNEGQIFEIAQQYGFEKMTNEGKSFMDQIKIYSEAEAVIGPHGAGFTNMIFAPNDATLCELFPKSRTLPFYSSICGQLGQRYLTLEGPILKTFADKSSDFGDFMISASEFAEMMKANFKKP